MIRSWEAAFGDLERQLDEVFDELIYRRWGLPGRAAWRPDADVYESDAEYVIVVDLPDVARQDLEVAAAENLLLVAGRRRRSAPEHCTPRLGERRQGPFERAFRLAEPIDVVRAEADYRHGTLRLRLPKKRVGAAGHARPPLPPTPRGAPTAEGRAEEVHRTIRIVVRYEREAAD